MARKQLFISVLIVLLALVAYNVLLHHAVRKSHRRQFLAAIDRVPPSTEVLFIGNSLMAAGCDADVFQSIWFKTNEPPRAVNLSLGDSTPVEHYLTLKRALARNPRIKYIVYGFFDDQLTAPPRGEWADLIGNRAFSYYFAREAAAFYSPDSRLNQWRMQFVAHVPMLAERSSPWERVELLRRRIDQVGMPEKKINRFGNVADFNTIDSRTVPEFVERCRTVARQNQPFSAPVQAIFRVAREHGVKVFLIEMPLSPRHRETFYALPAWAEMRAHMQTLAGVEGASYIAASDWVQNRGNFDDDMHLNEEGAKVFSAELATKMWQMVSVPATNQVAHDRSRTVPIAHVQ